MLCAWGRQVKHEIYGRCKLSKLSNECIISRANHFWDGNVLTYLNIHHNLLTSLKQKVNLPLTYVGAVVTRILYTNLASEMEKFTYIHTYTSIHQTQIGRVEIRLWANTSFSLYFFLVMIMYGLDIVNSESPHKMVLQSQTFCLSWLYTWKRISQL